MIRLECAQFPIYPCRCSTFDNEFLDFDMIEFMAFVEYLLHILEIDDHQDNYLQMYNQNKSIEGQIQL